MRRRSPSPRTQNALLALLAVAVAGIHVAHGLRRRTPAPPLETARQSVPAPLRSIAAVPLSEGLFDTGQWRGKPAIADLDRDGHADLVAALRRWDGESGGEGLFVWLGDGGTSWTPATEGLRRDLGYGGSRVADLDGDGALDIATSGHDVTPQVFLGDGHGKWRRSSAGLETDGPCADVATGDVDGDGVMELVTMGQFPEEGGLRVFRRSADGWEMLAELIDRFGFGAQVRLEDLDGDDHDEILAVTDGGLRVWRFGDGAFREMSQGLVAPEIGGSELAVLARDFDADGTCELVLAGMAYEGHAPLQAFRWDGARWSAWGEGLPADEAVSDLALGDVDGDGVPEIVTAGERGVAIIELGADGRFERVARVADTLSVVNVATGDVNGDGRDEVLCVFLGRGLRVLDLGRAFGGAA